MRHLDKSESWECIKTIWWSGFLFFYILYLIFLLDKYDAWLYTIVRRWDLRNLPENLCVSYFIDISRYWNNFSVPINVDQIIERGSDPDSTGYAGGAMWHLVQRIKKVEVVAYEELGPEAIRRIEVEDFPVVVINDIHGNDLYEQGVIPYKR